MNGYILVWILISILSYYRGRYEMKLKVRKLIEYADKGKTEQHKLEMLATVILNHFNKGYWNEKEKR